jgi:hypothetical protein
MDFYINRTATLPILKMELINDGRNDFNKFYDMIQNSQITFCMVDTNTGVKRIGDKEGLCILKGPSSDCNGEEYFIGYQFTSKETKKAGTFVGEFKIVFNDGSGTLIVPIKNELNIHVLEN